MPSPRLLHPIPVTIEQMNRSQLVEDMNAREAFHGSRQIARSAVTVQAQHKVQGANAPSFSAAGFSEPVAGYILVRTKDLRALGVVLKRGDRIVQVGRGPNAVTMDAYLLLSEDMAHYPSQGGAALQKWYYADRAPVAKGA
jgi:hypothetical protein